MHTQGEITRLLIAWSEGDLQALDAVFPLVFQDLRRIANNCCRRIPCQDLQPTELIGEIYRTLLDQENVQWSCRGQFYKFTAFLMERFLLSYKRGLQTQKRGGQVTKVGIEALDLSVADDASSSSPRSAQVQETLCAAIDIAEKIAQLGELDPQQAEVARLRYLIGLSLEETAETLGVSVKTVTRKWRNAKRFLALELDRYGG